MPEQRVFGSYARDEDGKQTRTVHSPGGNTQGGKQTLSTTPNGNNEAWLFERPGEEARRQDDLQSIRNSRNKNKRGNETGVQARVSLARRAESSGARSAEGMKPKALSQVVLRAEQSAEERDAQNERRKDQRAQERDALNERRRDQRAAEQSSVDARDALNARRRANAQVTISVRLAVRSRPHNPN